MDRDYAVNVKDPAPAQPLDPAIRMLADAASSLAAEVRNLSDKIHGGGFSSGAKISAGGPIPVQGWADEMRDMVTDSRMSTEAAQKEIYRIRDTLGL